MKTRSWGLPLSSPACKKLKVDTLFQRVKCWTNWKINNSFFINSSGKWSHMVNHFPAKLETRAGEYRESQLTGTERHQHTTSIGTSARVGKSKLQLMNWWRLRGDKFESTHSSWILPPGAPSDFHSKQPLIHSGAVRGEEILHFKILQSTLIFLTISALRRN